MDIAAGPQAEYIDVPLTAVADGPRVIVTSIRGGAFAMTPEAVLASLEPLRAAAEEATGSR